MDGQNEEYYNNNGTYKAIFLCKTSVAFPFGGMFGPQDFGFGKGKKYVEKLNKCLEERNMNWRVEIDDSNSDADKIEKENPDLIICVNGLQKRFFKKDFNPNRIVFLTSMELYEMEVKRMIKIMGDITEKNM